MSKHVFRSACVVAIALVCTAVVQADVPFRDDNLVPFYRDVRGPTCNPMNSAVGMITASTPLSAPLFDFRTGMLPPGSPCPPVLKSDGTQLTLGEFKAAVGRA